MRKVIVEAWNKDKGVHSYSEGVVAESESIIEYAGKKLKGYMVNSSEAWYEDKDGKHTFPNPAGFIAGSNDSTNAEDYYYTEDKSKEPVGWIKLTDKFVRYEISNYETSNAAESFAESSRRVVEAGTAIYDAMASGKNVMEPTIRYAVTDQWDYSSVILEL